MRPILTLAIVGLLIGVCAAQMPERSELTGTPRFSDDVPHQFREFTEAQLRAETTIVAARSYAVFGYNTPEVQVRLPHVSNSAYAQIDFSDPKLMSAAKAPMKYELERGGYNEERFSDEVRFRPVRGDRILSFAHARGSVKLKYPLVVKMLALTPSQLGPHELALKLDGPYVSFSEDAVKVPDVSFTKLQPIRAYDAAGRLLEAYSTSETSIDEDGVERKHMAFYGNVARLELDSVETWAELELPYDLTPAPLLPAGHEGEDPESNHQ